MLRTRLLIAASVGCLIAAAPLIAQDMQQPGMNAQSTQSDEIIKKKKKDAQQQQGQAQQGQGYGNQQQMENQATGDQGQTTNKKLLKKKSQQAQGATEDQGLGTEGQPVHKKKMKQGAGQTYGEQQTTTIKKLKKRQATGGTEQPSDQMTTGATGKIATEVPADKRTVVRQRIISTNVERIHRTQINVSLNVGVMVPRTVRLHRLPTTVIQIIPAYRSYLYFVLDDGTIVIVNPHTYEIVYMLTA